MKAKSALSLALVAGIAATAAAENTPQYQNADPKLDTKLEVGGEVHIYFNLATGEKIVSLDQSEVRGAADGTSNPIWFTDDLVVPCADFGGTESGLLIVIDSPASTNFTSIATGGTWSNFSEVEYDTVVDCVRFNWASTFADEESAPGAIGGDGVEGFAAIIAWWDGYLPVAPNLNSTAVPAFALFLPFLPGNSPNLTAGVVLYTLDIDLAADLTSSAIFELGDTDSDLNGADQHNAGIAGPMGPDADSDGFVDGDANENGLADVGYSFQFIQPGTIDTDSADSDSDSTTGIDGVGTAPQITGVLFGYPNPGEAVFDSSDSDWDWVAGAAPAVPTADVMIVFNNDPLSTDILLLAFNGGFGFTCGDPMNSDPSDDAPAAFFHQLNLGPGGAAACLPDLDGNGSLNFGDVTTFLTLYGQGDLAVDFDPNGTLNFGDVTAFLTIYAQGCP